MDNQTIIEFVGNNEFPTYKKCCDILVNKESLQNFGLAVFSEYSRNYHDIIKQLWVTPFDKKLTKLLGQTVIERGGFTALQCVYYGIHMITKEMIKNETDDDIIMEVSNIKRIWALSWEGLEDSSGNVWMN